LYAAPFTPPLLLLPPDQGRDLKSLALNVSSSILIVLPILCYVDPDQMKKWCGIVAVSFVVTALIPPMGWKRPHPYSDDPKNKPKI
jgi:hypothetical protein